MRLRLAKVDEVQFLTCVEIGLWGSNRLRFRGWHKGDLLAFIVDKHLAALSEISGPPFISDLMYWDNDLFPNRIPINFISIIEPNKRPPIEGKIKDILISSWGRSYGWGIQNKQLIEGSQADNLTKIILNIPNDIDKYKKNLSPYLEEARGKREQLIQD